MIFSYNWLQSFFKERLPAPESLAKLLMMHTFEVEETKRVGDDWVLDIAVLPNRSHDCFSHEGIARECAALLAMPFPIINDKPLEDRKLPAKSFVTVKVEDSELCPRYSAKVVMGLKVGPSPDWIQKRLEVCGLRPINNIVDITNYVMLELGQPLHAFDQEKIKGKKIIVRRAKKDEKITSLDGVDYILEEDVLVIADEEKPMAIAGIKGGKGPEIDDKTKTVVIESANFKPSNIRITSRKINLRTDASIRFEHGIDPNLTSIALRRAAFLIQKIAGGKVVSGSVDVYPKKVVPKKVSLNIEYVEKFLGIKIPEKEIRKILGALGVKYLRKNRSELIFSVPTRRIDILLQEDLIEEIGRIHGYEKIPAVLPLAPIIVPNKNDNVFWQDLSRDLLKSSGMTEVFNYSFVGEKDLADFGYKEENLVEIENPMSSDLKYLRLSLLPGLLKNVQKNQNYLSDIKIFEIGKVFMDDNGGVLERTKLSGLILGDFFYELKGIVDLELENLGIKNVNYKPAAPDENWHSKKYAEIKSGGESLGAIGELSSGITGKLKISKKVVAFELDMDKLIKLSSQAKQFIQFSRFPVVLRDLAVLLPKKIEVQEVFEKIKSSGGDILKNVELFDVYEGKELPEGKKNLAFHIIYQSNDRTLSSEEVDKAQASVIRSLEKDPEWEVRKNSKI